MKKSRAMTSRKARSNLDVEIRAMLFADTVGFSKLTESELPMFVRHFLGLIGQLIHRAGPHVISKNTWGDGVYLVFGEVRAAGHFALDLADKINRKNWTARGLPAGLNLRIGVHAGPVYACKNPIKQTRDFFGTHVSRAARIEPITPPGQVYASEAFAALAAGQQVKDLTFSYAGQVPTPKGYGTYPMYHMTRA
jgi:class 3 adenylate cyclase